MNGLLFYSWEELPFVFLALVVGFTVHEFAHAYTAYKFGDPTPKNMGRVTLNPRYHLSLFGTIMIFLIGFGWPKGVLIDRRNFKNPRLMDIIVTAAGPVSNLIIAFIGLLLVFLFQAFDLKDSISGGSAQAILLFLGLLIQLNMMLFIFNLIPLPPLDGYGIVKNFLPLRTQLKISQYEQWGIYVFLLIVFLPPLKKVTIYPLYSLSNSILKGMNDLLAVFFGFSILPSY
ncbi:site-2 protease family protein [Paenibacillus contaminans]|uniref:Site-2 protease family protein n=1 Tax=Paenibacillus contaminans TaxID=450362 RepID=A0A329MR48_9BACL|nr:site-2 protease family protein [Paenibacillus contaminans]RAV21796.1 site-2 protease family protein [Paenibacillus contaminans]